MMKRALIPLALLYILIAAFLTSPVSAGLTVSDGAMITTRTGASSPVITITGTNISEGDTIIIDVSALNGDVWNGTFINANILVADTADAATWEGDVDEAGTNLTLTSTGGPTEVGETVTVTFTGADGSAWIPDTDGSVWAAILTATRTDTGESADFNFTIQTSPGPGGLTITPGEKITTTDGSTTMVISVADAPILQYDTITIYVADLDQYISGGGPFTNANVVVNDTAANATWTGALEYGTLTLTSNDGATDISETVSVTFTGAGGIPWTPNTNGEQKVTLTAFRMDNYASSDFDFTIETTPPPGSSVVANFTASPTTDIIPLTVTFTDTSLRNPTSWSWDFGDGDSTNATLQNPVHTYSTPGTYTVSLTTTNTYGTDTKIRWLYIHALNGGVREANTSVDGLTINNCGGPQLVTVDTSLVPAALTPNTSVLEIQPPADRGLKNITIYALNGVGFSRIGNLISGNPTAVHIQSEEITPPGGFSNDIGTASSFNYSIDLPSYPCNAVLSTKIWEGVIPEYDTKLLQIASNNSAVPIGTAFTAEITKTNFPSARSVKIHMSVGSGWNSMLSGGPGNIFIWRISDDGSKGQILPTNHLYTDTSNNLDYYVADSPLGLSTFGISSLTGNNNPFQMITLILTEIISQPENPSSESNRIAVPAVVVTQNITPSTTEIPVPPDPGKTAMIYANAQGVVTQATLLRSTDGLAIVNISTGVVAKDAEGNPLSSITIRAIPVEFLPRASPGMSLSFAGRAYELLPDGAVFTPDIPVSFIVPNIQFGQRLMVKMYDNTTETWQEVPTSLNPQSGMITAHISHFCCFALFAETVTPEPAPAVTPAPPQITPKVPAPTAMSTFVGMILWVTDLVQKNAILFTGIIILAIAIYLYGRKRRRDRLMYLI